MSENPFEIVFDHLPQIRKFIHGHKFLVGIGILLMVLIVNLHELALLVIIPAAIVGVIIARKPKARAFLASYWTNQRQQRLLDSSLAHDTNLAQRPPQIISVENTPHATILHTHLPPGTTVDSLSRNAEFIASYFEVSAARILRNADNASLVDVKLIRGNPLSGQVLNWTDDLTVERSLWDRLSPGIDEEGRLVEIYLPEHSFLIGGEPGSGKTVFLTVLLMFIICCPQVQLYIFDGKEIDLIGYIPLTVESVGCDIKRAIEVMQQLREVMADRYATLRKLGLKKIDRTCGFSHIVVLIDELAFYVTSGKEGKEFAEALRDLIARARAAGIIVILTTQKPSADTVPTNIRDLISHRVAFRCGSIDASATILGQGWAGEGYSASSISVSDRGVGYLLGDTGLPQLFRSYYVTPDQEATAIESAMRLRGLDILPELDESEDGDDDV